MMIEIIIGILALGALNHLFFCKELTFGYGLKKLILPILCAVVLCLLFSIFTKNIYITTLPVWLLILTWSILGYIDYFKLIKNLIDKRQNK